MFFLFAQPTCPNGQCPQVYTQPPAVIIYQTAPAMAFPPIFRPRPAPVFGPVYHPRPPRPI